MKQSSKIKTLLPGTKQILSAKEASPPSFENPLSSHSKNSYSHEGQGDSSHLEEAYAKVLAKWNSKGEEMATRTTEEDIPIAKVL